MTTDTNASFLAQAGPLTVFRIGLSVYGSEMKWLATSLIRRFEISRLAKRLQEEYTRLGQVAEAPRGKMAEKDLCLKQISFLKEEMETLERELEARRMERVNLLRSRAGAEPTEEQNGSEAQNGPDAQNGPEEQNG